MISPLVTNEMVMSNEERAEELKSIPFEFINSDEFETLTLNAALAKPEKTTPPKGKKRPAALRDLPGHLRSMCEGDLLTAAEEQWYFRRLNFVKYKATMLCEQLDLEDVQPALVEEIEELLALATATRNHLVESNMRLVISIVKKFVSPRRSFDDLLSDGIISLMKAVDKFDYSRGFRFSTYAYRAIVGNAMRKIGDDAKKEARFVGCPVTELDCPAEKPISEVSEQRRTGAADVLGELIAQLDPREQIIVEGRFALGDQRKVMTFQSLADHFGVSKERVRQLSQRALSKLERMAAITDLEERLEFSEEI